MSIDPGQPVLKSKVVGTEGNLEQLLIKAYFEEAKIHELLSSNPKRTLPVTASPSHPNASSTSKGFPRQQQGNRADEHKGHYNCGYGRPFKEVMSLYKIQQVCTGRPWKIKPTYSTEYFHCSTYCAFRKQTEFRKTEGEGVTMCPS